MAVGLYCADVDMQNIVYIVPKPKSGPRHSLTPWSLVPYQAQNHHAQVYPPLSPSSLSQGCGIPVAASHRWHCSCSCPYRLQIVKLARIPKTPHVITYSSVSGSRSCEKGQGLCYKPVNHCPTFKDQSLGLMASLARSLQASDPTVTFINL